MFVKSKLVELELGDRKAKEHLVESLNVSGHSHLLSRRILKRFLRTIGRAFVIIGDWYPIDRMETYDYTIPAPAGTTPFLDGDRPTERLVAFVRGYLETTGNGLVICKNWGGTRRDVAKWPWPPPRVACYGDDEVYHIVTPGISEPEMIEAAIAPRHQRQTGVCSLCYQDLNADWRFIVFDIKDHSEGGTRPRMIGVRDTSLIEHVPHSYVIRSGKFRMPVSKVRWKSRSAESALLAGLVAGHHLPRQGAADQRR